MKMTTMTHHTYADKRETNKIQRKTESENEPRKQTPTRKATGKIEKNSDGTKN